MSSDLVAARPGGFDILPAHAEHPTLVHRFAGGNGPALWLSEGLSNAWMLSTEQGRMIVNTGMGFEGPVHRRCFDSVDQGSIHTIVFTQGHVDHVGGTDAFLEAGTEVIAHAANARCQADDARIHRFRVNRSAVFWAAAVARADAFLRARPADPDSRPPTQATPVPTRTFEDRLELEIGGVAIRLVSVPGGETTDSLVVWFPAERVAIVGNLFGALFGHVPNLTTIRGDRPRDALAFVSACDEVLDLDAEVLCTGHFAPVVGAGAIRSEIVRIRDAVQWLHDSVVDGMNRGTPLDTLQEEIRLPAALSLGEGYGTVRWAVRAIWEGYAGWFRFASTTELHAVARSSVDADIVGLAGPDALVAAALAHLDSGNPLQAIQLLEPVRSVEPGHGAALDAYVEAHRVLLDGDAGNNFWETGWLRMQIDRAERDRREPGRKPSDG